MPPQAGGGGRTDPVEVAEAPQIGEADEQHAEEKEHIDYGDEAYVKDVDGKVFCECGGAAEGDGPGVEERDFHIEDEENQRDDVEAEIELDVAGADGGFAALIDGGFCRVGRVWTHKVAKGERDENEGDAEGEEDGERQEDAHRSADSRAAGVGNPVAGRKKAGVGCVTVSAGGGCTARVP